MEAIKCIFNWCDSFELHSFVRCVRHDASDQINGKWNSIACENWLQFPWRKSNCATGNRRCASIEINFWLIRLYQMHSTECSTINRLICDGTLPSSIQNPQNAHITTCLNLGVGRHYRRRGRSSSKVVQLFAHSSRATIQNLCADKWFMILNFMKFEFLPRRGAWCVYAFCYTVTFGCGAVQLSVSLNTNAPIYIYIVSQAVH